MREINGTVFYTAGDVSALLNKSRQTIVLYDVLSDFCEQEHKQRFIPKPIRVNGQRLYTKEQVREIKRFADSKKNGQLAKAKIEYEAKKKEKSRREKRQCWAIDGNERK